MSHQPPLPSTKSTLTFNELLNLPLPPSDNFAWEYGYGYGEDFDFDYELLSEASAFNPHASMAPCPPSALRPPLPPFSPFSPILLTTPTPATSTPITQPIIAPSIVPSAVTPPATPVKPPVTPAKKGRGSRSRFSPAELEELARTVYNINPHGAKHGDKKVQWLKVEKMLKDKKMFLSSSVETIKNKMSALLAWHEVWPCMVVFDCMLMSVHLSRILIQVLGRKLLVRCQVAPLSPLGLFLTRSPKIRLSLLHRMMSRRKRHVL